MGRGQGCQRRQIAQNADLQNLLLLVYKQYKDLHIWVIWVIWPKGAEHAQIH